MTEAQLAVIMFVALIGLVIAGFHVAFVLGILSLILVI